MADLRRLLEVQAHDTAIDQLEHRRRTLAERVEVERLEAEGAALDDAIAARDAATATIADRQAALEVELNAATTRIGQIDKEMFSGRAGHRDLEAMQHEIESLKARASGIEDEVLAAMEEQEPIDAQRAELSTQRGALDTRTGAARAVLAEAEVALEADLAREHQARDAAAAGLEGDLVARYDALRKKLGGVGVAPLVGPSCSGCHLTLPASELAHIRKQPPDAVVFCEQCGRILVRDAGLSGTVAAVVLWFVGLSVAMAWAVFHDPALDHRLVVVGAVAPVAFDLAGVALFHTVVVSVVALALVMAVTVRRRPVRKRLLALPIGLFLHLVLDAAWTNRTAFWWPAFGTSLPRAHGPFDRPLVVIVAQELVGLAFIVWAWRRYGLADDGRRGAFASSGRLELVE